MKRAPAIIFSLLSFLISSTAFPSADLRNFVVIGDSLAAGYQSGTITPSSQQHSFPVLIAQQAGVNFTVPTLVPPPILTPIPNNLAVPGERVCDTLSVTSVAQNPIAVLHNVMLGSNNTQVSLAQSSQPTTLLVEIGSNDVFLYAIIKQNIVLQQIAALTGLTISQIELGLAQGDPTLVALATAISAQVPSPITLNPQYGVFPTPVDTFTTCYANLMDSIANLSSKPAVVISTIPDVMTSPYIKLLSAEGILNNNDLTLIQSRLTTLNQVITAQASSRGVVLYDAYAALHEIGLTGYVVGGQRLNTNFYCGVFSLDGVHPTNTIDGAIANDYINVLNSNYGAGIPPLSVVQIEKVDPLIDLPLCASPTSPAGAFNSNVQQAIHSMNNPGN